MSCFILLGKIGVPNGLQKWNHGTNIPFEPWQLPVPEQAAESALEKKNAIVVEVTKRLLVSWISWPRQRALQPRVVVAQEYYQEVLEVINFGYSAANKTRHSPYGMNAKMSDLAAIYCLQWLRRAPEIVEKHEELEELFRQEVEKINNINRERGIELEFLQDRSDRASDRASDRTSDYRASDHSEMRKTRLSSANIVFFPPGTTARVEPFVEQGIECKKYYAPLAATPVAEDFYRRVLCFPLHVGMGKEEIAVIGEALATVVKSL